MMRILIFLSLTTCLVTASPVVIGETLCNVCSEAVQDLEAAVTNEKLHARVMGKLEAVCGMVTSERSEECNTVISGLTQEVLRHLLPDMKPMDICMAMTACPAHTDVRTQVEVPRNDDRRVGVNNMTCELCEFLVQTIDAMMANKTSPAEVNATAFAVCEMLPEPLKDTCITFAPLVVEVIVHGVNPFGACTNMGVCLVAPAPVPEWQSDVSISDVQDGPACELCELLVQTIDQYLKDNHTEAAINATVYKLCNDLPGTLKDTCLEFAPQLVSVLSNGVDPKKACTAIKLCTNSADSRISQRQIDVPNLSDGLACELCELLVQTIDQYLKDNKTEAAINATVYKLCNDLPDTLKTTCLAFAPQLVSVLSKGVDPKKACTTIKLCTNSTGIELLPSKTEDGPACELCELLVQTIDQYLKDNKTAAAINATVYKLCNDLPDTLKTTCLAFAPQLVSVLSKGVDPKTACTSIKLCTNSTGVEVLPSKLEDGPACELCQLLVQTIDQYLKDNNTAAAINATVYKLCNDLPDTAKATCLLLAPQLVSVLSKGVDPKTACTAISLCTNSTDVKISLRQIDVHLPSDSPACELCELLVQTIDQYLKDNKTEAAINATVYKLCNDLPDTLKTTCLAFAPELVSVLANGADPKKACTAIKLCTNSTEIEFARRKVQLPSDGLACELCELLVQTIDQYLKDNKTEAAINATVYKLCNDLPDTLKTTCLAFAPQLVSVLSKGVDQKRPAQLSNSARILQLPTDGLACELCELLVQTIDQYLKDNKTEAAINATVYKLCNDLPDTLKTTCLAFAPQLVSVLSKGADPKKACTAIKLCTSSTAARPEGLLTMVLLPRVEGLADDMWCTICKDHIGILDEDLYNEEGAVQKMLDDVCHRLPPPTDQACLSTADAKFPEIWENFLNGTASAENICKLLKACPK